MESEQPRRRITAMMMLGLVFATLFSGTGGGVFVAPDLPNELTQIQNGTATVTITGGTMQGTATVTYSPVYSSVPKLTVVPHGVLFTTTTVFTPDPQAFFQSGSTQIWTNMPAVDTEIYGDANGEHRVEINLSIMSSFRLGMNCVAPSNTAGAYLTIMYNNGGVWTELNSAQRFLIDGLNAPNACPTNGTNEHYANPSYSSLPSAVKTSTAQLRIDGVGGGGIGDIPSFSSLWIDWSSSATGQNAVSVGDTGTWRACATLASCAATPPVATSTTGFVIAVSYPLAPTVTQTVKFTWFAGVIA